MMIYIPFVSFALTVTAVFGRVAINDIVKMEFDLYEGANALSKSKTYKIIGNLGNGTSAEVYSANLMTSQGQELTETGETYAIKLPKCDDPNYLNRLKSECLASMRIHENGTQKQKGISYVFGHGKAFDQNDREICFATVMDIIVGKNFNDYYLASTWSQKKLAVQFMIKMLPIIEIIHKQGVIHRDIKPGNILVTSEPGKEDEAEYTLIDFDIAYIEKDGLVNDDTGGTPEFACVNYVVRKYLQTHSHIGPSQVPLELLVPLRGDDLQSSVIVFYRISTNNEAWDVVKNFGDREVVIKEFLAALDRSFAKETELNTMLQILFTEATNNNKSHQDFGYRNYKERFEFIFNKGLY